MPLRHNFLPMAGRPDSNGDGWAWRKLKTGDRTGVSTRPLSALRLMTSTAPSTSWNARSRRSIMLGVVSYGAASTAGKAPPREASQVRRWALPTSEILIYSVQLHVGGLPAILQATRQTPASAVLLLHCLAVRAYLHSLLAANRVSIINVTALRGLS